MPQNLSIGCTTFCAEAGSVVVKATITGKVDGNKNHNNLSLKIATVLVRRTCTLADDTLYIFT